jgi:hypothetical protein
MVRDGARAPPHHEGSRQEQPSLAGIDRVQPSQAKGAFMGRYLLLWMLGVPLPILVLIYAFGGLH